MRAAFLLITIATISGCARSDRLPTDMTGYMLTSVPQQAVANCIARQVGGSAQPSGDGQFHIVVANQPTISFDVGPNRRDTVNTTRVLVRGFTEASGVGAKAATCIVDQRRPPAQG